MTEPSDILVELSSEKLKRHKSPGIYQITADVINMLGGRLHTIKKIINL